MAFRTQIYIDNSFYLKPIIDKKSTRNLQTYMTFLDLQKECDTIPNLTLWTVLSQSNVNYSYTQTLQEFYVVGQKELPTLETVYLRLWWWRCIEVRGQF